MTGPRHRWPVLLLAGVMLTACGGGSDEGPRARTETERVGGLGLVRAGSTAQFADCAGWRRGTVEERRATITSLRDQLTPQRSVTADSALSDGAAYRMFDKTCSSGIADSLRLYKIYARAQAFAPLAPSTRGDGT
jgi:hypothetical protein